MLESNEVSNESIEYSFWKFKFITIIIIIICDENKTKLLFYF
jgi:hypothetical protein